MRKSRQWLIIAAALLLVLGVGATVAYLVASPVTVTNTFTVGNVVITLQETTGAQYKLSPGATLSKDPTVTVKAYSESCWLFVKVEADPQLETFCTYELQSQWTALPGYAGIYYCQVAKSTEDQVYSVLKDNCVVVKDTVTEQALAGITTYPTLKFTAYAVQSDSLATPEAAWQAFG